MGQSFCSCFGLFKKKDSDGNSDDPSDRRSPEGRALREGPRQFDHPELYSGTNGFNRARNLIGEGGFGPVFRGRLRNGQVVAIKRLNPNGIQGIQEFRTEIMMLSHLDHPNVIKLIGYCANEVHRIVVYEYMPMGSLDKHLFDRRANQPPLDWNTRMKIATGAARGLEYLHNRRRPQIIYRDVKSSNILLDKGFEPKLSDFGLARLGPVGDATHVTTRVMGTYGYCAPEYAMTGHLTTRTDVYSFGVVLLEILTGRRAIDNTRRDRNEENLVLWARPLIRKAENFPAMVDPLLQGRFPLRCFLQAMAVAAMCIHEIASARPEMNGVVQALELLVHPEDGPRNTAPEIRLAPPPPQEGGGASPVRRSSRSAPLLQGTGIDPPVRRASHEGGRSSSSAAPRQQGTRIGPPVRRASHDAGPSSSAAPQQQFIRINMPVQRASYDGGSSSSAPRRQGITIDSLVRRRRRSHDGGSSRSAPRPPRPPGGIRIGSPIRRGGDRSPSTHRDPPEIVEEGVGIIIAEAVGTPSVGSSSQLDEPGRLESQPARSSSLPGGSESRPAGSRSPPDEVGGSVSRRPGKEPVTETETDRERAVAEAMEWAEHLREERAAGKEIVDDTSDDTSD